MLPYREADTVWGSTAEYLVNPPKGIATKWWPKFTEYTGGLREHELTLLCAPTGAGKTQLLANLSVQFLSAKVPHFVAPVETGDVDYLARVASVFCEEDLNNGDASDKAMIDGLTAEFTAANFFKGMFISTHDNRIEIQEMVNTLAYMKDEYGIKVALLDNLNFFLKTTSAANERIEMDNAIHEFVMLVKKLPIHVILIVHPKKTDGGRVESEFDIKGSSTAVQEASNVCLFNRPTQQDIEAGRARITQRELVFKKIRKRGVHVGKVIRFTFNNGRYEEAL